MIHLQKMAAICVVLWMVFTAGVITEHDLAAAQQQPTPSQTAQQAHTAINTAAQTLLQVDSIVGSWSLAIEALQKQNADLQAQLTAMTKELEELKKKHPEK